MEPSSTYTPWPFIQTDAAATEHGFALWPLYGYAQQDPRDLIIHFSSGRLAGTIPTSPRRRVRRHAAHAAVRFPAILRHGNTTGSFNNEDFLWPFFGYTDRTLPNRYHETRYFWPFLVQGHGDEPLRQPLGAVLHALGHQGRGQDLVLWPLLRQANWTDGDIAQKRTQFLYLLYWSQQQTQPDQSPRPRPPTAPTSGRCSANGTTAPADGSSSSSARLRFSSPTTTSVRETWTPFFAIYRYDQRAPGDKRWSLLWEP